MEKIIYLIRHSEPMKKTNIINNSDSLQLRNEKNPLSIAGEKKAEEFAGIDEFIGIDYLVSSNYVRAISTAKYFSFKSNIDLNINENFGERKHGVNSWDELPIDFEKRQLIDKKYKIGNGENQEEVAIRMYNSLCDILNNTSYKKIVIVSHATAIIFLLMKFGSLVNGNLIYRDKIVIDKDFSWNAPDGFKLVFNDNELVDISHICYNF